MQCKRERVNECLFLLGAEKANVSAVGTCVTVVSEQVARRQRRLLDLQGQ